ncbi:substrate-binding periplasmic protein [Paraglaciecola sp. 2405UD69-4]|uniref:substrate-binding periplasmic protein n=1 Tax=Paraglaciecola sp. 2405UD69-4 TaxID=3391836 RepID=UPI0039C9579C
MLNKTLPTYVWFYAALFLSLLCHPKAGADTSMDVLKVGILHAQEPPFVYFNPKDEIYAGILIDMSEELGRRMGLKVEFIPTPRNKVEANILSGEYNATFLAKSWVSIQEKVLFSEPFYYYSEYLYSTTPFESSGAIESWARGKTICTRDNFVHPVIDPLLKQNILNRLNVSVGAPIIKIMMKGRCDLALIDEFRKEWLVNNIPNMSDIYRTPNYVSKEFISLMLNKDWQHRLQDFDSTIITMKQTGVIDEIVTRHSTRKLDYLDSM